MSDTDASTSHRRGRSTKATEVETPIEEAVVTSAVDVSGGVTLPAASYNFQTLDAQLAHVDTLKTDKGRADALGNALKPINDISLGQESTPEGTAIQAVKLDDGTEVTAALPLPARDDD